LLLSVACTVVRHRSGMCRRWALGGSLLLKNRFPLGGLEPGMIRLDFCSRNGNIGNHWSDVACLQRLLLDIVVLVYLDLPFAGYMGLFFDSTSFVLSCRCLPWFVLGVHPMSDTLSRLEKNIRIKDTPNVSVLATPFIFLFQTFLELFCRVISGERAVFEAVRR
jgi:hypothetical protein